LEALKIRGISTSNALETFLLKPIQKYMSLLLLQFPCFKVTGTPLKAEYLSEQIPRLYPGEKFLSGDYDNATNEMLGRYTRHAITLVAQRLNISEDYQKLCIQSLCDNTVLYTYVDKSTKRKVEMSGRQIEAQPMGKVLSFVILCIVNAAVCRKAQELDRGETITLKDFEALINGDDCCFALKNFEHWVGCSGIVGLNNSVGKTFFSRDFIEMNSRSFIYLEEEALMLPSGLKINNKFVETPFVNFGLMKGMVRSGVKDESLFEKISAIGERHHKLLEGIGNELYDTVHSLFRYHNNDVLMSPELTGIPYFVPRWLGGLGLRPGRDFQRQIPPVQRRQASEIFSQYNTDRPKMIGDLKTCLLDPTIQKTFKAICLRHNVVCETLEYTSLLLENDDREVHLEDENLKVYNELMEYHWRNLPVWDLKTDLEDDDGVIGEIPEWIGEKEGLTRSDLQELLNERNIRRKIRHNAKLWIRALSHQTHRELSWEKLWTQQFKRQLPIVLKDRAYDNRLLQKAF